MKPTLLLPVLLALLQATFATSQSDRILASCSDGCVSCKIVGTTTTCLECYDDYVLTAGVCKSPYVYKNMVYLKSDHYLLVNIDGDGHDIPVYVIFAILAFVVYLGSLFFMQKQDWKALVPEEPKEHAKPEGVKEHAKALTPKGEHVVEIPNGEDGTTPGPKSATPGSPAKNSQANSHRSQKTVQEEEEENLETSPRKGNEELAEEDEEPYYPTKKEMATRNGNDYDEEDADQVEIQVHDAENIDEDEQRTAQETPSPKTDFHSTPKGSSKKRAANRKGSNHSDNDYEDDDKPQVHSNIRQNQHRGNQGEEDDEEFESARSGEGHHEEEQEEAYEDEPEEEEEEHEEHEEVMDLNDLGIEHGEKKH